MSALATLPRRRGTAPARCRTDRAAKGGPVRAPGAPAVVRAAGELDLATAPAFRARLLEAVDRHPAGVVVDLSQVTFADCRAVGALIAARNRARELGRPLALRGTPPSVVRLLRATGTHTLFPLFPGRLTPPTDVVNQATNRTCH